MSAELQRQLRSVRDSDGVYTEQEVLAVLRKKIEAEARVRRQIGIILFLVIIFALSIPVIFGCSYYAFEYGKEHHIKQGAMVGKDGRVVQTATAYDYTDLWNMHLATMDQLSGLEKLILEIKDFEEVNTTTVRLFNVMGASYKRSDPSLDVNKIRTSLFTSEGYRVQFEGPTENVPGFNDLNRTATLVNPSTNTAYDIVLVHPSKTGGRRMLLSRGSQGCQKNGVRTGCKKFSKPHIGLTFAIEYVKNSNWDTRTFKEKQPMYRLSRINM